MSKLKIIVWDVETSPIVAATWDLYPNNGISHDSILEDWYIICGAWKELGAKSIKAVAIKEPKDDYEVVKKLRDVVSAADILVHHNGDKFDLKKLNARIIFHGLEPLPPVLTVDTLKEVRKIAKLTSNRLDYIAKILLGRGKIHVPYQLWLDVMKKKKGALKTMVDYNKEDVAILEEVYEYLRPYMKSHPNVAAMETGDRTCGCPKCGSLNAKRNGIKYTAAGLQKQEMQCNSCHSYYRVSIKA